MGKAQKPSEFGKCFWKGEWAKLTLDHVPAKCIFPPRVHSSLPNVRACSNCNAAWKLDGQYFRDYLLVGPLANCKHPDLGEIRRASLESRKKREATGRKPTVFGSEHLGHQITTYGLGAPKLGIFQTVNMHRIYETTMRIFSAIAYGKLWKLIKPEGYEFSTLAIPQESEFYPKAIGAFQSQTLDFADGLLRFGGDAFPNDPKEMEMLILLYGEAVFYARTFKATTGADEPRPYSQVFDGYPFDDRHRLVIPKLHVLAPEPPSLNHIVSAEIKRPKQTYDEASRSILHK